MGSDDRGRLATEAGKASGGGGGAFASVWKPFRSFENGENPRACVRGCGRPCLGKGRPQRGRQVAYRMKLRVRILCRVAAIVVQGNRRVDSEAIIGYVAIRPGERADPLKIDEALKALYATGLFEDVRINMVGNRLVVTVAENPVISRIAFEGNKKVKDATLIAEIQSKARGPLSRNTVQADVQRIIEVYRRSGRFDVRVEPKIIARGNSRVNLVFEVNEGDKTTIQKIVFVGNKAFS